MRKKVTNVSKTKKEPKPAKTVETLTPDELKTYMKECEDKYHASFKQNSCRAIMNSYHEWQDAKKRYYISIGVRRPDQDPMEKMCIEEENEDCSDDFNSLI